jgi:hypothetical protein
VLIDHPDEWIGIPEHWPNARFETAYEWASELIAVLAERFPPATDDQAVALRDFLVTVANSRLERGASRVYISLDDWAGSVYIADMTLMSADSVGAASVEALAGEGDPTALEEPRVESFATTSGIVGARCIRYIDLPDIDGIMARVDYVFPVPDGFVRLYTAQFDLVEFDGVLERMDALARSVGVVE